MFGVIADVLAAGSVDCVIVEKRKTMPHLQEMQRFYPEMLGHLLRHVVGRRTYSEVIVITDRIPWKKKRKAVEKAIKQTLARMMPPGVRYRVLHHESKSSTGLQIADYCNCAIFRKWTRGDARSYERIRAMIGSELDILASEDTYYY